MAFHSYLQAGGEALRLDYALGNSSIVMDVGGFTGDFAWAVAKLYGCEIHVFEPIREYADKIEQRLRDYSKIRLIRAGLGASERYESIHVAGRGSSIFAGEIRSGGVERIKMLSVADYIQANALAEIGLMKINIEGGEYELLYALLEEPTLINRVRYLQIQFHDFVPGCQEKRLEIQSRLAATHRKMWDFPFIWESWERQDS